MKTAAEIINIIIDEIEISERRWDRAFEMEASGLDAINIEREKDRALDEMTILKVIYRKITGKGFHER